MKLADATAPKPWTYGLLSGAAVWAAAWTGMLWLDGKVDLANLAMVLVLGAAVATLWLPVSVSVLASTAAVLAFNWVFVPPRGTFVVDLRQDALLLGAMLLVTWIVAALIALQRAAAEHARGHAQQAEQLRRFGDALRDSSDPLADASLLQQALAELSRAAVKLLVLKTAMPHTNDADSVELLGAPTAEQLEGLWHCARRRAAFGPGTGRYEELQDWYLPLRSRDGSVGAAFIEMALGSAADAAPRQQAQALCDQYALALERAMSSRAASDARNEAQTQSVRNAMLAAISHDYRTPLATIMGAASSLADQGDRLDAAQRERLARTIVEESIQLSRLTDNTLQLARLDAPGMQLRLDWESAEELVGTILRRVRGHDLQRRVRARLEPGLPLVRCDALLLAQMLDNLVDNALKYSESPAPVEILVRRQAGHVVFAVRDRGAGVAPAWRERIFDAFQRGLEPGASDASCTDHQPAQRGAGVGLAVCRAIARAHGGEMRLRARAHGGSSFEFWLPEAAPPAAVEPQTDEKAAR